MKANSDAQSAARTDAAIHTHTWPNVKTIRRAGLSKMLRERSSVSVHWERKGRSIVWWGRGLLPGGRAGLRRLPPEGGLDVVWLTGALADPHSRLRLALIPQTPFRRDLTAR